MGILRIRGSDTVWDIISAAHVCIVGIEIPLWPPRKSLERESGLIRRTVRRTA